MKNKNQYIKAGGILSTLILGIVIGILAFHSVTETVIIEQIEQIKSREWQLVPLGADPGSGLSGVWNVSLVKHDAGWDFGHNLTRNTSFFGFGETNNTEIGANVPYGIKVDIVVKVVWNRTMLYNTTSKNWTWDWVNATIALTLIGRTSGYPGGGGNGFNITGEWNCSEVGWVATNERVFAHYVFGAGTHNAKTGGVAAASGNNNGISINKSQRCPTVYFKFFAYF